MPSTCLPVSEPLMSSHPSPEEDIRAQTYLAPSTGTSSIGFELAWSSPFFFHCSCNLGVLPGTGPCHPPFLARGAGQYIFSKKLP